MSFDPGEMQLFVAVHTHGSFTPRFVHSLAQLTAHLPIWHVRHAICIVEDPQVERGRNKAVAAMLEGAFTHLLFLDADLEFQPEDALRLLQTGKDVVGGAYRQKNDSGRFEVSFLDTDVRDTEWDSARQALEVEGVGTGFMLIRRHVFEEMARKLPEIAYEQPMSDGAHAPMHAFFESLIVDGRRVSEDYLFCRRWRALGGTVWVLPGVRLRHWGRGSWEGMLLDSLKAARDLP